MATRKSYVDPEEEGAVQDPVVRAAKAAEGEEQTRVKWSRKVEQNGSVD